MKNMLILGSLFVVICSVACQKKGSDDPGPPAGCPAGQGYSSYWARCVSQTGCQQGLGVHPEQPANCMNLTTGTMTGSIQCGAGFYLTARGCFQRGHCGPGQALAGELCVEIVSGSGNSFGNGFGNQQMNQQPAYGQSNGSFFSNGGFYNPYYGRGGF